MATYLTRTPTSSGSNTTWTFSCWYKKTSLGLDTVPWATGYTSPQIDEAMINIGADDQLRFNIAINDATDVTVKSARKLRDVNAWYHIVVACDTTQGTASNRIKFYINGELETNLSNTDYPTQNQSTFFGDTNKTQEIGRQPRSSNYLFGVMSHVHFCDGYAYTPTEFGETDANGVWTIKTSPSVTYGTNGFFILKDSALVTDQSGNGNNFTVGGGTLTDTLDCPANVFATFNPLHFGDAISTSYGAFSNGNTTYTSSQGGSPYPYTLSTLAPSSGKWYAEFKFPTVHSMMIGVSDGGKYQYTGDSANDAVLFFDGNFYPGNSSWGSAFSDNDIVGVAMDLDNMKIYWHKNGTYFQSGDPTSGATGTGAKNIPVGTTGVYHFVFGDSSSGTPVCNANFGNGYFGTTAVASAGTNASGNGIFEYDVPTGYTALCTKGLNGE